MKKDPLLNTLLSNLENEFRSLRQDLSQYSFVVDITRVDPLTRAKLMKKKFIQDSNKFYGGEFTGKKANTFLVLKNRQQLKSVENIISTAASGEEPSPQAQFTQRTFQGPASQARVEKFLLERSSIAEQKFAEQITKKTNNIMKYASPEFHLDFSDQIKNKLSTYKLSFNLPDKANKELEKKLIKSATATVRQELRNIKKNTLLGTSISKRVDMIKTAFLTGKILNIHDTTKTTKKSTKKISTKKIYYVPLQTSSGFFTSVLSLIATLNTLLHDTIQKDFMESSSARVDPNYLRYQTGRFARSAVVTNVGLQGTNINIDYDYMTYPYETFKGGKHGPNRNPERIIEGAIRTIIIQHITKKFTAIIRKV